MNTPSNDIYLFELISIKYSEFFIVVELLYLWKRLQIGEPEALHSSAMGGEPTAENVTAVSIKLPSFYNSDHIFEEHFIHIMIIW